MNLNTDELNQTLNDRFDEMKDDRESTNDYIVEDIMLQLGYNKRKDRTVRCLHDKPIDWEVVGHDEALLAVRVFPVNTDLASVDSEIKSVLANSKFNVIVVTNGTMMSIYFNTDTNGYKLVNSIKLCDKLTASNQKALDAISKDGYDISYFRDELTPNAERLTELIHEHSQDISELINKWLGTSEYKDIVSSYTDTLGSITDTADKADNVDTAEAAEAAGAAEAKVAELEEQLETYKSKESTWKAKEDMLQKSLDSSASTIVELNGQIADLNSKAGELNTKVSELTEQLESVSAIKENEPANEEDSEAVKAIEKELEDTKQQFIETEGKLEETEDKLEEANSKIDELNEKIAELEDAHSDNEEVSNDDDLFGSADDEVSDTDSSDVADLTLKLSDANIEIDKLRKELEEAKVSGENSVPAMTGDATKDDYVRQIRDLTVQLATSKSDLSKLNSELKDAQKQIDDLAGADVRKAQQRLAMIEDDVNQDRSYVSVINTEIKQSSTLGEFAGACLEKLHELKQFDADQFIFNGDVFKIMATTPGQKSTLMLNQKQYIVITDGMREDEVLNKLRIVFSHFNDVVFECKKIGTLRDEAQIAIENGEEPKAEAEAVESTEETAIEEDTTNDNLIVSQLSAIDQVVWYKDEPVNYKYIKYIGSNDVTFSIGPEQQHMSNDLMLCKSIDAIMALEAYEGKSDMIVTLKQKDLSQVNNFIKPYSNDYADCPKISGTRYVVSGIESVQQVASVIADICSSLGIDTTQMFVYMIVNTTSEYIVGNYGFNEESVQLIENLVYKKPNEMHTAFSIIHGNFFNSIVITKNSLAAHKEVILQSKAIKTKFLSKVLNSDDDYIEVVQTMLQEAIKDDIAIQFKAIGNVIGEQRALLSDEMDAVGADSFELNINGNVMYLAKVENWQVLHALLKIYGSLFNDTSIAIKTLVNTDAINFYGKEFATPEPSLYLAVKSFVDYTASKMLQPKVIK